MFKCIPSVSSVPKTAALLCLLLALAACSDGFKKALPAAPADDQYLTSQAAVAGGGTAPTTVASVTSGLFSPQSVSLTCNAASGTGCLATYYTIDGTTPSRASSVYTAPIALWTKTTLKYFSVDRAGNEEAVKTQSYLIGSVALQGVAGFVAGRDHTLARKVDGTLWAWGANGNGQLGDGSSTPRLLPSQVGSAADWAVIAAGDAFSVAIKSDGTLWSWGRNDSGQLGLGSVVDQPLPAQVGTDNDWRAVQAGAAFVLALKTDGTLWAWGANGNGQLGNNSTTNSPLPVAIGTGTDWSAIAAGYDHAVGLKNNGTLWAWGGNSSGQLGQGTTTDSSIPLQVPGTDWSAVSAGGSSLAYFDTFAVPHVGGHTLALKSDGTLWAWGENIFGQLGDGTDFNTGWSGAGTYPLTGYVTFDRVSPLQIGTDTDWARISAGAGHSVALKNDGTLWAWGLNVNGQLANGNPGMNNLLPLPVGAETYLPLLLTQHPWSAIAAGDYHTLALRSDGTLWAWGWNGSGQLGDGTTHSSGGGSDVAAPTWRIPKFAYVLSDKVYPYTIDYRPGSGFGPNTGSGQLSRAGAAASAGAAPVASVLDPAGRFLYVIDGTVLTVDGERVSMISTFAVDRNSGDLTPVGDPAGVKTLFSPTSITVDPLGKFVYVVGTHSKGWQTIAVYTINPATGELSCIGTAAKGARSLAIEPLGRFAYVLRDVGVTGYSIDQRTGMLSSLIAPCDYDRCDDNEDDAEVYLKFAKHLKVDLSGRYLYVAKDQGSVTSCSVWGSCSTTTYPAEVRVYSINQTSGRIYDTNTPQGEPAVSAMVISPSVGDDSHTQFMYMLFNNNLNGLRLNQLTGQVTDVGLDAATGALGTAADPTGKFIYAFTAKHVLGYAIDSLPPGGKTQVIGTQANPTKMATDAAPGSVTLKSMQIASY